MFRIWRWSQLQRGGHNGQETTHARADQVIDDVDVDSLLPQVTVPTVVLHCRDEAAVPFEEGRRMAAGIPGARFVALEGRNHLIMKDEPAWPRFLEEVRAFLV